MKARTKETLLNVFKSVISNQAAVDGAKNAPSWIAIIFFILSVILPLIPVMVTYGNAYGGSFMDNTYRYTFNEASITSSMLAIDKINNTEFRLDSNHILHYYQNDVEVTWTATDDKTPLYRYIRSSVTTEGPFEQVDLEVYYTNREFEADADGNSIGSLLNDLLSTSYVGGTITKFESQEDVKYKYRPSYLVFHKYGVIGITIKTNTETTAASSYAYLTKWNYVNVKEDTHGNRDVIEQILEVKDESGISVARQEYNETYQNGVYTNLKTIFTEGYSVAKWDTFRNTTLIYASIFIGLIVLMGFIIWLLTRGKKNIYNYLKIWTCMKMEWWIAFTPALIGLVVGFLMANQSLMVFVMAVGMRTMWLSMKQLKPQ